MYLSRVELDLYNRKTNQDLNNLNSYHGFVESCFPEEIAENERSRKLWRIDYLGDKKYILIVSENKPDLAVLEKYGVKGTAETKNYDNFLNSLKEGMKLRYRVQMNTVKSEFKKGQTERGKIVNIKNDELLNFIADKGERNGFEIDEDNIEIKERSIIPFKKGQKKIFNLASATYEGILTITDKEKLIHVLTKGIGKKKAYGFGLMTVIPID